MENNNPNSPANGPVTSPSSTLNSPTPALPTLTQPTAASASLSGSVTISNTHVLSPTTLVSSSTAPKSSGVSPGAVAGVAIACLIAGAVIAGIVVFLIFKKRNKRQAGTQYQHHSHTPYALEPSISEKAPASTTTAVSSNIDNLLPQPVEDDAITKELSRIRDNVKNHVRTYYHQDAVIVSDVKESGLVPLASATGTNVSALVNGLLSPSTRGEIIRLFIAWATLTRCSGERHTSLLPDDIARLAMSIPGADGKNAGE